MARGLIDMVSLIGAPLLAVVLHLPQGDWRMGAPPDWCDLLQGPALILA